MVAIEQIKKHIEENKSYVLEAGAGSGKTYTLIQTINHVLETRGETIKLNNQKIVCITYTNVAKNEIIERLENNPLVIVSTIHEFLWDCIKRFNKQLIIELDLLNDVMLIDKPEKYKTGLKERITEVTYDDSGYRDFEQGSLHHDDVIALSLQMFKNYTTLTQILGQKYPYIFIDEYQDTASETVDAIINYLLERNKAKLLVGFYGDSYQKIYDEGIGSLQSYIDDNKLELVTKDDNYRSSISVVNLLNNIRDNITQTIPESKESIEGSVQFINCTNAPKLSKEGIRVYNKRIIPKKDSDYQSIVTKLEAEGWDFSESGDDKILIIANSKVAERAGFGNLYKTYSKRFYDPKAELLSRENHFATYFFGSKDKKTSKERETGIEHLVSFWENKNHNRVIKYLKQQGIFSSLAKHSDKQEIETKLNALITLRKTGTVKDVFNFCKENKLSLPSRKLQKFIEKLNVNPSTISDEDELKRATKNKTFYNALMLTNYSEMICAFKHIQEQTSYSTKHGTKGEEYRNVLVVIDDTSWPQKYNFEKFFNDTDDKEHRKLRTKNLFYVSCSRAKENLVVLALSQMGESAMDKITEWFGAENTSTP
ncbi:MULTISPECIES: UvrD-helicase domain-containing protein [unclassified Cellulophaga]|uniref:UvrD-helicase domain-containing protein n=1 Tax=unclassified Cellulophaga TaxID=2634405 RepID=UPI0026E29174|nr:MULTISPECIES: UvrD-helicase domain-containing protein [unclassified Cellulophaga]MDO6490330.1 AAA family ATPase [Cellulophaga sp. 2_MG-2023]MDO6494476.1 AAA family ATPase [Cellulophaga sp. 3_MG-2023]